MAPAWRSVGVLAICVPAAVLGCGAIAAATRPAPPPDSRPIEAPREQVFDMFHGVRVNDPYRWLEDERSPRVRAWMAQQAARTSTYFDAQPARDVLAQRLRELSAYDLRLPPEERGGRWFFRRADRDEEKDVFCYRETRDGADQVLIDPNQLSADGSVSVQGFWPSPDGRLVAYKLAHNNTDAAALRVREVGTRHDLARDLITGANPRTTVAWLPNSGGFYYIRERPQATVAAGEQRQRTTELMLHELGADPRHDLTIVASDAQTLVKSLEVSADWLMVTAVGAGATSIWIKALHTPQGMAERSRPWITPFERAGFSPLVRGEHGSFQAHARGRSFFVHTTSGAPRGRVIRIDADRAERAHWAEIVPQHASATIAEMRVAGEHLVVRWFDDVKNRLEVRSLTGELLHEVSAPSLQSIELMSARPQSDELYYSVYSFAEPPRVLWLSARTGKTELWTAVELPFDSSALETRQVFFASKDGRRIPMFLVHRRGLEHDGDRPTLLTGYGGFGVSVLPHFVPSFAVWLEHGGVLAVPNLRGGGEYGEEWHRAGAGANKQNVFDDFIAAARWLISEKLTRPQRLAIKGGSNGGLLVGAAMTQHPELFQAVVCEMPLLDMLRYHRFDHGPRSEYGVADHPQQFETLHAYSPYHHVESGTRYPALLMISSSHDDRVDPLHARKFLAAVQRARAGAPPALLRLETSGGHRGSDSTSQRVTLAADTLAFLFDQMQMSPRQAASQNRD